jgi:formamidopyrimidine-DNA glycosylase
VLLSSLRFPDGQLNLVEFSTKKRASIYLLHGTEALVDHRRTGLNVFETSPAVFHEVVAASNRTLKRMLTDPSTLDGIGNAYSDEILFHARLSPVRRTGSLSTEESSRLLQACRSTLEHWIERLQSRYPEFPKPSDITAFREDFAVHGRYGKPCPSCGAPVQRIVYSENETNYCAHCQNEGRLLADRSLSRLLKSDWPKTLEEMEGG